VANDQRRVIYHQRNELLEAEDISATIRAMRTDVVGGYIDQHIPRESLEEQWDVAGLERTLDAELALKLPIHEWLEREPQLEEDAIRNRIVETAHKQYEEKIATVDLAAMRGYERALMLQSLDTHWREHLAALDHLRQGIHLRGYAQKNPTQEYKREAFELFSLLLETIKTDVTKTLMWVQIRSAEELQQVEEPELPTNVHYEHPVFGDGTAGVSEADLQEEGDVAVLEKPQPFTRAGQKIGRNEPCPCGSGKKYKHCHGKLT
ncbi:MAG: SEC-C metal-binding domain-containing protein, partial [Burkholderiales bacterium]